MRFSLAIIHGQTALGLRMSDVTEKLSDITHELQRSAQRRLIGLMVPESSCPMLSTIQRWIDLHMGFSTHSFRTTMPRVCRLLTPQ
jgi:hypothetical protein